MWSAFVAPAALAPGFDLKQPDRSYSFGRNLAAEICNFVFATNNISNGQKRGSPTHMFASKNAARCKCRLGPCKTVQEDAKGHSFRSELCLSTPIRACLNSWGIKRLAIHGALDLYQATTGHLTPHQRTRALKGQTKYPRAQGTLLKRLATRPVPL